MIFSLWNSSTLNEKLNLVVPWGVSCVSMVLSILNVTFGFSGMLVQQENEENMVASARAKHALHSKAKKDALEDEHNQKVDAINARFKQIDCDDNAAKAVGGLAIQKTREMKLEGDRYVWAVEELAEFHMKLLEVELSSYREEMVKIRVLLASAGRNSTQKQTKKQQQGEIKALDELVVAIGLAKTKKIEDLKKKIASGLDPTEFEDKLRAINDEYETMVASVRAPHVPRKSPIDLDF